MVARRSRTVLGKIAAGVGAAIDARAKSGEPAGTRAAVLASGPGWEVADVICTAGPRDRVFEEQHGGASVAAVVAGTFQYRTSRGMHMMTPGSLFLGNPGECFECGHEHATGDRCIAFRFTPEFIHNVAAQLGRPRAAFGASRLPAVRQSSALVATMMTALAGGADISWEEAALDIAALAFGASPSDGDSPSSTIPPRRVLERVTHTVREIEQDPSTGRELHALAAAAELSTFQFLRVFRRLTGATPHQYLLRARLRESAASLRTTNRTVAEIALDCGFNDLSNFNHTFRAEFGMPPRAYRTAAARN